MGQIIKSVFVCQCICPSASTLTVAALSIEKWTTSTAQRANTPEPNLMKLDMVDYIRDHTPHENFGEGSATWVVWANM